MNFKTAAVALATLILATVAAKAEQKTDLFGFSTGDTFEDLVAKLKATPMKAECRRDRAILVCYLDGHLTNFYITKSLTPPRIQAIQYFFSKDTNLDEIVPSLNQQFGSNGKLIRTTDLEKTYEWKLTPDIEMTMNSFVGSTYVLISNKRIESEDEEARDAARRNANPLPKF